MIDCAGRDRQHRQCREHCEDRYKQEYGPLRDCPSNATSSHRYCDITGMVERGVAAHASGQLALPINAECDRRDGRAEDITND